MSYEEWFQHSRGGRSGGPGEIHQIGGLNKRGDPILREREAIQDILDSPDCSNETIYFWDKTNPAAGPVVNPHLQPSWGPVGNGQP